MSEITSHKSEIDLRRPNGVKINSEETDFIREDAKVHKPFTRGKVSYSYSRSQAAAGKQDKRN